MERAYTVLLIEDDEDDYLLLQAILDGVSCCTIVLDWVDRYDQALKYVEQRSPDLLVVDYNLNHSRTGIDLVREVKESGKAVPAILVSGQEKESLGGDEIYEVVDEYLNKLTLTESLLEEKICLFLVGNA